MQYTGPIICMTVCVGYFFHQAWCSNRPKLINEIPHCLVMCRFYGFFSCRVFVVVFLFNNYSLHIWCSLFHGLNVLTRDGKAYSNKLQFLRKEIQIITRSNRIRMIFCLLHLKTKYCQFFVRKIINQCLRGCLYAVNEPSNNNGHERLFQKLIHQPLNYNAAGLIILKIAPICSAQLNDSKTYRMLNYLNLFIFITDKRVWTTFAHEPKKFSMQHGYMKAVQLVESF